MAERSWGAVEVQAESDSFRDYWVSKPGAGAIKLDWEATWRNWVRSSHRNGAKVALGNCWESPC